MTGIQKYRFIELPEYRDAVLLKKAVKIVTTYLSTQRLDNF